VTYVYDDVTYVYDDVTFVTYNVVFCLPSSPSSPPFSALLPYSLHSLRTRPTTIHTAHTLSLTLSLDRSLLPARTLSRERTRAHTRTHRRSNTCIIYIYISYII